MSVFDLLAKEWDLNPNRVNNAKAFYEQLKSFIDLKDKKIIDYGAGTGLLTFMLCDRASEVLAMDNSKGMLEELEKKAKKANVTNIKSVIHDIEKEHLPFGYDLFASSMTMHHIKDTKEFIKEAKRSLKKGGYIAISDLVTEDGLFHTRGNDGVYHFGFDLEKLGAIFDELKLKILYLDTIFTIKKDKEYPIFLVVAQNV